MATRAKRRPAAPAPPPARYAWREGARYAVPAAAAGAAVESIERRDGRITPAAVVDEARDAEHALHGVFCWDDSVAAQRHREGQARQMIGSLVTVGVTRGTGPPTRVAFVSVTHRDHGRGYLSTATVMTDADYRRQVVSEARTALEGWRRRYAHLSELAELFKAIDGYDPAA